MSGAAGWGFIVSSASRHSENSSVHVHPLHRSRPHLLLAPAKHTIHMMTDLTNILGLIFAVAICVDPSLLFANASNFNKPHAHTGKVEPFKPGDPNVKLDGRAKGILKNGKPYQVSS